MTLLDILFLGIFWMATLAITYRYGLLKGRAKADRILGQEHRKALQRIKRQADRNQ